jgi:hypothetical protein
MRQLYGGAKPRLTSGGEADANEVTTLADGLCHEHLGLV